MKEALPDLGKSLDGDLFTDRYTCLQYATDASVYREVPLAVCRPATVDDMRKLIVFAKEHNTSLIPRTAGTSLAGQVVGGGIVMDISKYFTRILELNKEERWVKVQPGVVLDELNLILREHGLFFAPETSTGNRCMIGGMVGNNSCGAHSLIYGSTRDHVPEVKALLSDGTEVLFGELSAAAFEEKQKQNSLEGKIYRNIRDILGDAESREQIRQAFPDPRIHRRNMGYALDLLSYMAPFAASGKAFNFSSLLCGSEGTLAFITEIKLDLLPLPPRHKGLLCVHFQNLNDAFTANLIALQHHPGAIELMDHKVLEQTKNNIAQRKNRFFLKGDPAAVMIIEWARETPEEIRQLARDTEAALRRENLGYHFPLVTGEDISRVWELRKAGLGVLNNIPGDAKPVAVIEDTSVHPEVLPDYLQEFQTMLREMNLSCVYYAHIATGELHLRPVLNLKEKSQVDLFHRVAERTAGLVKKYNGSLSGEHGDGRLRGEFIPKMLGEKTYQLLRKLKYTWDPDNILNPGKIVDSPSMMTNLRYKPGHKTPEIQTYFDFSDTLGILRAAEQCNGSGDCRKPAAIGGTMCPTYQATLDENASTRARANILREFLTGPEQKNPFNHKEIYRVMDLCLSCKACKSECPSNVDITKYKAEFLQHYYDANTLPLRNRLIANITAVNRLGMIWPWMFNVFVSYKIPASLLKKLLGFAPQRSIPSLYKITLRRWMKKHHQFLQPKEKKGRLVLFVDEFSNYNDTNTGITAVKLLSALGYEVVTYPHKESGRTYLSKGLLRQAAKRARENVVMLGHMITEELPLIGIEPSGILSFRDEYPQLVGDELKGLARSLAENSYMLEEFIMREVAKGNIESSAFEKTHKHIKLHGHCHQKALASTDKTKEMLSIPQNYSVEEIPGGCCGMAGSFGYEKEHYRLSMQVGELSLFPAVRKAGNEMIIAAPGTSCRQQIRHGTGKIALHPVEVLWNAFVQK
ncbi:MAG: FAD-linked oxidase C-terminal domain-containing protein [Bacteroidales bacterium]